MKAALAKEVIVGEEEGEREAGEEDDDVEDEDEDIGLEKKGDDFVSMVKEYIPDAVLENIPDVVFENVHIVGPIFGLVVFLFLRWILRWILWPFSSRTIEHNTPETGEEFAKLNAQIEEMHAEMKLMRQAIQQLTNLMLEGETNTVIQDLELPEKVG